MATFLPTLQHFLGSFKHLNLIRISTLDCQVASWNEIVDILCSAPWWARTQPPPFNCHCQRIFDSQIPLGLLWQKCLRLCLKIISILRIHCSWVSSESYWTERMRFSFFIPLKVYLTLIHQQNLCFNIFSSIIIYFIYSTVQPSVFFKVYSLVHVGLQPKSENKLLVSDKHHTALFWILHKESSFFLFLLEEYGRYHK